MWSKNESVCLSNHLSVCVAFLTSMRWLTWIELVNGAKMKNNTNLNILQNTHFVSTYLRLGNTETQDSRKKGEEQATGKYLTGLFDLKWGLRPTYPLTSMFEAWKSIRLFIRVYIGSYCLGIHSCDKAKWNHLRCWLLWLILGVRVNGLWGPGT